LNMCMACNSTHQSARANKRPETLTIQCNPGHHSHVTDPWNVVDSYYLQPSIVDVPTRPHASCSNAVSASKLCQALSSFVKLCQAYVLRSVSACETDANLLGECSWHVPHGYQRSMHSSLETAFWSMSPRPRRRCSRPVGCEAVHACMSRMPVLTCGCTEVLSMLNASKHARAIRTTREACYNGQLLTLSCFKPAGASVGGDR
jgi:hypothetical protein